MDEQLYYIMLQNLLESVALARRKILIFRGKTPCPPPSLSVHVKCFVPNENPNNTDLGSGRGGTL